MVNYIKHGNYFDKEYLISIFNDHKESKLRKYSAKKPNGEIIIERDYYELYFSYKNGAHLFDTPPCRGYQFVYMPPNYEMVIHKDIYYIKSRLGTLLQGTADIIFYDDDDNIIDSYDYAEDILTDVQVKHNVKNNNEWRLSFFANFEESVDVIHAQL